ncbi:MAG: LiaF-related protein [candidate division Zixibacteria bacterium]|nr:LiaF-related protein [candidate division Zixibacteria bacterium]
MMRYKVFAVVFAVWWLTGNGLLAHDRQVLEKNFPADSQVKKVSLSGDISAAEVRLDGHDGGDLFAGRVRYDADRTKVDITLDKSGSTAELEMTGKRLHERGDFKSEDNAWSVSLSRDYTWDINIDVGATECELDLSGLSLEEFTLDAGASECEILFDRPNPREMKRFSIDAGAGSVELHGLGYARCRDFELDGGAGSVELDFNGFETGFLTAHIDVGVGEVKIKVPKGVPVHITADDGWLSSVDIDEDLGDNIGDGEWESDGYKRGTRGLDISIDVGIGQVTVNRSR